MTPRLLTVAALAAASLTLPTAAQASTISYAPDGALEWVGGAGGTSVDLRVTDDGRAQFDYTVGDQPSSLPAGCSIADLGEPVLCTMPSADHGIRILMNEGDDDVAVRAPMPVPVVAEGGPGADELVGNIDGGDETLSGGTGNDLVRGYAGWDVVDGGAGDDRVEGGSGVDKVLGGEGVDVLKGDDGSAIEADVIDGGGGYDTLDYEYSTVGREGHGLVNLSLDAGESDDGFAEERDDVRGIEKVQTSTGGTYDGSDGNDELFVGAEPTTVDGRGGDDTIYTSYSNDTINGGAGNDTIRGYSGDDKITGGPGQDTIFGDTQGQTCMFLSCSTYIGNDVIDARDGERDSIDCGLGTDTALVDAIDVTTGCEDVQVAATPAAPGGGQQTTTTTTTPTTTTTTTAKPGARACATPKGLKGLTSTKAKARVRKAACKVKTRSVRSKKVKKGRVVKVARKGSTVTIYVSKGR